MEWRAKVELFEQIRREYEFGIGTIAGVAKKLGAHRRMVHEAIGSALPKPRKKTERPRSLMIDMLASSVQQHAEPAIAEARPVVR